MSSMELMSAERLKPVCPVHMKKQRFMHSGSDFLKAQSEKTVVSDDGIALKLKSTLTFSFSSTLVCTNLS